MVQLSNPQKVIFRDGSTGLHQVLVYQGACLSGDVTTYVSCNGQTHWVVKLNTSPTWLEV